MKSLLATLALTTALTIPGIATARTVRLTTTLSNYGGDGAHPPLWRGRSGAGAGQFAVHTLA